MRPSSNARWLLVGDGLCAFGTWIDFLAILTLAAYQFHVSPWQMALIGAAGLLPGSLLGPWIGRRCDRGDPKRLLLLSIAVRAATTGAILLNPALPAFIALVALRSVCATVAPPAINVMAVRGLETAERPRFYALLNVLNNTAKVLAPSIGTVASSLAGESLALLISIAFSLASFVAFAVIRPAPRVADPAAHAAATSADTTRGHLLVVVWIAATAAFFVFMVNNLVPLVLQRAGLDKALLGVLVSCSGAGNILSGLWLARRGAGADRAGRIAPLLVPATLQAVGFGAIGLLLAWMPARVEALLALLFFAIGMLSARYAIALNVHMSTQHAAAIGRAWGVVQAWQNTMIFVAPLLGALVLERAGAGALFGFATGTALLSFALLLGWRHLGKPRVPDQGLRERPAR